MRTTLLPLIRKMSEINMTASRDVGRRPPEAVADAPIANRHNPVHGTQAGNGQETPPRPKAQTCRDWSAAGACPPAARRARSHGATPRGPDGEERAVRKRHEYAA